MQLKGAAGPGHLGYHLAPNKAPRQLGRRAGDRGRERGSLEEGAQRRERGEWRERESALFFLPSSERVAIDTVHLIKIYAPPLAPSLSLSPPLLLSLERRAQAAACPALAIQAQVQSTAGQRERRQTERRLGVGVVTEGVGGGGLGHMPPPLGLWRGCTKKGIAAAAIS